MTTKGSTMRYKRGEKLQDMTRTLKQWLFKNKNNPYPTKRQKMELAQQSGMSLTQVSNWFANARRRLKGTLNGAELPWEKRIEMYDVRIKNDPMESEDSAWESGEDEAKENIKIEKPDLIKDTEDKIIKPDIISNPLTTSQYHPAGFGSRPIEGLSSPPLNKDSVPMPFVPQNLLPAPIMQSAPLATSQSLSPPPVLEIKPFTTTQSHTAINEQTPYTGTHISPLAVNTSTPVTTTLTDPAYLSYLNMVSAGVNNSSLNNGNNNVPVPTSAPISTNLPVNADVQASLYTPIYNYLLHCEQLRKALNEAQEVHETQEEPRAQVSSPGPVPSPSEPIKEEYPKSETPKYKSTLLHRYLHGGVQIGENIPEDRSSYEPPLDLRTRNRHFSGSVGSQEYENISEADTSGGDMSMTSHWDNNTSEMSHLPQWQPHPGSCNNNNDIYMATDCKESSVLSNRVLDDWDSIPHTEEEDLAMKEICAIFTLANLARTRNLATKTEQS